MSAPLQISAAHRAARNQASLTLADAGVGTSCIRLYDAQGGQLLATLTLAKPCGRVDAQGRITLLGAAVPDLVQATGRVAWAEWCDGAGNPIAAGAVTDAAGDGPFRLAGANGALIYEGGLVLLDGATLG